QFYTEKNWPGDRPGQSGSGKRHGLPRLPCAELDGASPVSTNRGTSGKKGPILANPVLQGGGQLVHIYGRNVHYVRVEQGDAVASDRVATYLDQQSLQCLRVVFLRCHAD